MAAIRFGLLFAACMATAAPAMAADEPGCRFICGLEWKVEPTFTIENLANRHRVVTSEGATERVTRERVFETVLALDMGTRIPRLGFTVEAITSPFSDDNSVELEFESNIYLLTGPMTRGWVTSHFDVVDQLSPAERLDARSAYTHKLDLEWDTAVHAFKNVPVGWLRGLELEMSLDYLVTGLPKAGDRFDDELFLDDASHWAFSFVFVIPVAPF